MKYVNTVTGKIDFSELGRTLVHEHLRICSEAVRVQFPHIYDEEKEFKNAVEQVNRVKMQGIKTICDPTVMGIGRDVHFMEKVALETEMQIICATGIYTFNDLPQHFQNRNIDYMAQVFIRDIEVGIQNTSIKAGFLKCATDEQGFTPDVEKVIRAVAQAHQVTGVPIMTHSHPQSMNGIRQLEIFREEGVAPNSILIGHTGDTDNLEYIVKVLSYGAFIGMDRYGITARMSSEKRNTTVIELVKQGFSNRMFLSQDYCCSTDWFPESEMKKRPKWTMSYIMDEIVPELIELGVTEAQIKDMMLLNAQRWFKGSDEI
ncbi:phosphotriesterase [Neobacillus drentensis]|jgi:phosphotriesterase-related protein|uniref:phosphotriesterase family protein n=1 Tax=Bacillaceae TaxID=186817 RepID=UPI000BFEA060|nr:MULTISPECIES: aryldialkylphosphatase [unclassified Bacillus (in: firmicutes)]MBV7506956.1 phosphotriesterase [Bacillus sp. sid0103]PGY06740.1 aryldialkylphosphatase [Bacillus sp. AFS031507]